MAREIVLTRGFVAVVDDEDFERVSHRSWQARPAHGWDSRLFYAKYTDHRTEGAVLLHRLILGAPPGVRVDHKDGDGLNCRRANMRLATSAQNAWNTRGPIRNRTGFRGVFKHTGGYRAVITQGGVKLRLGVFATPEEAAVAFDTSARQLRGEFATLNFPDAGQ